jgi:membrane protease YdiL (CAAX protease family)
MRKLGLILGVVVFLAAGLALIKAELILLLPLLGGVGSPVLAILGYAVCHLAVLLPMLLMVGGASRLSRISLRDTGLFFHRIAWRHFLWAGAVTIIAGALTCLVFIAVHRPVYAVRSGGPIEAVVVVLITALATAAQAGYEQLWTRSWPLAALAQVTGRHAAVVALALAFAALHLLNPQYSWMAVLNTALAGLMMGYAFFKPADGPSGHPSVWLPWGLHWGWNFVTGGVFYNRQVFEVTLDGQRVNQFNGAEATVAGCLIVALAVVAVIRLPAPGSKRGEGVKG